VVADPGFLAEGSLWLIAIGVLGALVAAVIGLSGPVRDPDRDRGVRTGLVHMSLNLAVIAAYVGNFLWRQARYGRAGTVALGPLLLSRARTAAPSFQSPNARDAFVRLCRKDTGGLSPGDSPTAA
jgi:hypothetical protein